MLLSRGAEQAAHSVAICPTSLTLTAAARGVGELGQVATGQAASSTPLDQRVTSFFPSSSFLGKRQYYPAREKDRDRA